MDLQIQTSLSRPRSCGETLYISVTEENGVNEAAHAVLAGAEQTAAREQITLTLEHPKIWRPSGYGKQPLYRVQVLLKDENGEILEQQEKRIGIRTMIVSCEKDQWGNEFAICVNGVKIFAQGGDYIPQDALITRVSCEREEKLLKACRDANFNCIRVWGGGYYPSDSFYDRCDELGLIVWQDLMFACNVYDFTDQFRENIGQEIHDNVNRLKHHACIALWCGNNEMESAWDHWEDFQKETPYLRADYIKQFEEYIPDCMQREDPDHFFWPSSPSSGGCFDLPDDENRGDAHYWAVWHGMKPFTDYRKHYFRFCSEFGFQSFPCLKTVESYTVKEDRNIFSEVMESHQKNASANGKMLYYLSENFRYPKDFASLLYVTQILQAMAVQYGVEHWKRNRGRCMGTLYWQINDNWPVASWSSIDYFGRWKALHYAAKRFYAPVSVSLCITGSQATVWICNETMSAQKIHAAFRMKNFQLDVLQEETCEMTVPALSAQQLFTVECKDIIARYGAQNIFAQAGFTAGSIGTDTSHMNGFAPADQQVVETFVPYKYLRLPRPHITASFSEQGEQILLKLQTDCFAPFTMLDFEQADAVFSDNNLMLTEKSPYQITIEKKQIQPLPGKASQNVTLQMLSRGLQIMTLAESYT